IFFASRTGRICRRSRRIEAGSIFPLLDEEGSFRQGQGEWAVAPARPIRRLPASATACSVIGHPAGSRGTTSLVHVWTGSESELRGSTRGRGSRNQSCRETYFAHVAVGYTHHSPTSSDALILSLPEADFCCRV